MLDNCKIVKIISNLYTVEKDGHLFDCHARGKFRNTALTPLVGDECLIDAENNYILDIHPRRNELTRPPIANVDIALVITSCKEPNLSLNLLDKLLCHIMINHIEPIICLTKLDLLDASSLKDLKKLQKYYQKLGIKVVSNKQLRKIKRLLKNKTVVLTGQTGAGKSTLLNRLDKHLDLQTQEISTALGRGKHTTRHVELYPVKNFLIADTPGFSSLELTNYSTEQIKNSFSEFQNYTCPFKDCAHTNERDCAIKEAVKNGEILPSRYENYLKFLKEGKKC